MIGVIDYGAGNLGSVMNALKRLSVPACFVRDSNELSVSSPMYEKIIFPGDGHFVTAMASLEKSGYSQAIKEWINADKPFLGICIGMQLLFDTSEEALSGQTVMGLSLIPGSIRRFPVRKVPHIGWNRTFARPGTTVMQGLGESSFFYYIHSYYAVPTDDTVCAAEAEYGLRFCSAIQRGALTAVQFHPEKSGTAGLMLLQNWLEK